MAIQIDTKTEIPFKEFTPDHAFVTYDYFLNMSNNKVYMLLDSPISLSKEIDIAYMVQPSLVSTSTITLKTIQNPDRYFTKPDTFKAIATLIFDHPPLETTQVMINWSVNLRNIGGTTYHLLPLHKMVKHKEKDGFVWYKKA